MNRNCPKCKNDNTEIASHDYSDQSIEIRLYCGECDTHFCIAYEFKKGVKYLA